MRCWHTKDEYSYFPRNDLTESMNHSLEIALQKIYGAGVAEQMSRYQQARHAFSEHFGDTDELLIFRAPGRVKRVCANLFCAQ